MTSVEDFCLFSITMPELESWVFAEILASDGVRLVLTWSSLVDMVSANQRQWTVVAVCSM